MATTDESSPFRCSICFNNKEGRQPRALPCLHSFCNECLKQWHEKRHREGHCAKTQVECPACRTKSVLPSADVSRLPLDINVQQFADYINKESKNIPCHLCKYKEGHAACLMCSVILCKDCSDKHKEMPLFKSHVLTESICQLHGAAIQGVCSTCLCGVCLQCVDEDLHKGHSLDDMPNGIKMIKEKVRKCSGELEELVKSGEKEVAEKRKYIQQCQCMEDMKRTLDMIKREIERLEEEVADHERLCKAKIHDVFKEYDAQNERASAAILNGNRLLEEHDGRVLDKIRSSEVPDEQMYSLLRTSLSSIPDVYTVALSKCQIENANKALGALVNCKVVCGIPDVTALPVTPGPPAEVLKITCGENQDIRNPGRLCGTPEGDVIVCNFDGGPVYKVYKDGTKTRLLDDGIAACVHDGDVYVISKDGGTVTQIKQDGTTANYKINPPISKPRGLAVSGENVVIHTSKTITKRSFRDSAYREVLTAEDCTDLRYLLRIRDGVMTKLVVTTWSTNEVIICDQAGSVVTRFGGYGSEDGLLKYPAGISRMSNGHLLVADSSNHRIVEYTMDGTFVRSLLTGTYDPRDIVFKFPYLWVLEYNPKTVKLFRFSQ